ncbi:hypothetical protein OB905_05030 [Halobacteria archaeon AArc-dxtr1]|nr:hypothetical protein [Halobacteria archaeon AArc-dxtr1]
MIAIVESRADRASEHICERLRELADWERREDPSQPDAKGGGTYDRTDAFELRSFEQRHLEMEHPAAAFSGDPDLLVFASRHAGETGPLLTGHFTGNFGPAEYGGEDRALAAACPNALVRFREAAAEYAPEGYDIGLECTHHGPTDVGCPSLFAELGSSDEQWDDPEGATAVARAILALAGVSPHRERTVVGFGGGHYVPRFERIVRETPWAVGHVAADWALSAMGDPAENEAVIERAFVESGAELAVVDDDRPELEGVIENLGYRTVSEAWLREVGDRPLELVARVEDALGPVADGVQFGERIPEAPADGDTGGFAVVDLPAELAAEAEGIDPDRVRRTVATHSVAFETENGGSRVGERAALPSDTTLEPVVEALAEILEESYETVRVESDAVVAEGLAFDPSLASEAGVPEGPKFGALASGSPVTVDGKTVEPGDVRVRRTSRFPIPSGTSSGDRGSPTQ